MNILLLVIPILWTGPAIPYPDCVEIVSNNSVILHADPLVSGCSEQEVYQNMYYYQRELGFNVVNESKDFGGTSHGSSPEWLTMEKNKEFDFIKKLQ